MVWFAKHADFLGRPPRRQFRLPTLHLTLSIAVRIFRLLPWTDSFDPILRYRLQGNLLNVPQARQHCHSDAPLVIDAECRVNFPGMGFEASKFDQLFAVLSLHSILRFAPRTRVPLAHRRWVVNDGHGVCEVYVRLYLALDMCRTHHLLDPCDLARRYQRIRRLGPGRIWPTARLIAARPLESRSR